MSLPAQWLVPDWPAPRGVRAFVTTRHGGVSEGEFASMNLGARSGDDPARVARNRLIVRGHLPRAPRWMAQVHGSDVARLDDLGEDDVATADAAVCSTAGVVACVLTADCMPLLLADAQGGRVAVAHAGWRGMSAGVVENAVRAMGIEPARVLAWLGPTIGPEAFEVGSEVREAFVRDDPEACAAFRAHRGEGKSMADLYALARRRLARAGVEHVFGGGFCTYREQGRFFSYRREPRSGRMGAFIWME